MAKIRTRRKLGKYRIEKRLGSGGFATVYRAFDTIQGVRVALKIPHVDLKNPDLWSQVLREVRLLTDMDHPGILPIRDASFIDGVFTLVHPIGEETLDDRLQRRLIPRKALNYAEQLLEAVAYAHHRRVIHCDIKPENVILLDSERIALTDFGIAKIAQAAKLPTGAGTGTIGYLAPEQAFGRPTFRSDVFAIGLVVYRMCAGDLPEWPYRWPGPGHERLRRNFSNAFIEFLHRACAVDEQRRYRDAGRMLEAFKRIRVNAVRGAKKTPARSASSRSATWPAKRMQEFRRRFGKVLETRHECPRCHGPIAESMFACPWCARPCKRFTGTTNMPGKCKRCGRGAKRDWPFCAWCYGGKIQEPTDRVYSDRRYSRRCGTCRGQLLPFSRYCPHCRTKVTKPWRIDGVSEKCPRCRWDVVGEFWVNCPWCARTLGKT